MIAKKAKKNKGFVILFAVMISGIILAIALGIADIALKETNFSTSANDTDNAFFAADVGAECALYYDRSDLNAFGDGTRGMDSLGNPTVCAGTNFDISAPNVPSWVITIPNLGSAGNSCAIVNVSKNPSATPANLIVSKGYSTGSNGVACTPVSSSVERELDVNY